MTESFLSILIFYIFGITSFIYPIILFYKYGPKGKNKVISFLFIVIIINLATIIHNNLGDFTKIVYDYLVGYRPFWMYYTVNQLYGPIFSVVGAFILQYTLIYFYTNKKFLIGFFIIQFCFLTYLISGLIYDIFIEHPTFYGPNEVDYEHMKYE